VGLSARAALLLLHAMLLHAMSRLWLVLGFRLCKIPNTNYQKPKLWLVASRSFVPTGHRQSQAAIAICLGADI
jgi:hypothetical protein